MIVKRKWLLHTENVDIESAETMWKFLTYQKDSFKIYLHESGIYPGMDPSNGVIMRPKFHVLNYIEFGEPISEVRFESYEVIEMFYSGKKKTHRFPLQVQTLQCAKIAYEKARQKYNDILYASGKAI